MRGTVITQLSATDSTREYAMTLRFVGIDPNTGGEGSPTVWVEEESSDLIFQGEEADALLKTEVGSTQWVPGHKVGIPRTSG